MLTLTRRIGESILIDDKVKVTVTGVQGRAVKLTFTAPESISIQREERLERFKLRERINQQNQKQEVGHE